MSGPATTTIRTTFRVTPTALAIDWYEADVTESETYRKLKEHVAAVDRAVEEGRRVAKAPTLIRGYESDGGLRCEWVTDVREKARVASEQAVAA